MPSNYGGAPANAVAAKVVIAEPIDADSRNAASVNTPLSKLADYSELLLEQLLGVLSSNWTARTGVSTTLNGVGANVNTPVAAGTTVQFVAVGSAGVVESSPDGKTWTTRTSNTTSNLFKVTFGNSLWVAVGGTGAASSGTVITSPDGITWTQRTNTLAATNLMAVAWSQSLGQWVAAGTGGAVFTSTDAITWTARTSNITGTIIGAAFGAGIWVVIQTTGATNNAATSTDGITWTARTISAVGQSALVFGGGQFVAFDVSNPGVPWTSANGTSWTVQAGGNSGAVALVNGGPSLTWNGRQYLATSGTKIYASIDGKVWVDRDASDLSPSTSAQALAANTTTGMMLVADLASTARYTSLKQPAAG